MGRYYENMEKYISDRISQAEHGKPEAYYDLGLLFSTGHGVDADYVEAHKWFNLAAIQGVERAKADRAELAQDMDSYEIAEAQRMAREWIDRG
ncbi:MAG: sel1 repeat family protein [Proteobacteria bacterium]|nr:sel1 repeat family protein [Pseudomonadota bacterium]